ncbi:MAG: HAD family phosphatase [Chthoniobacteraceae bacterium]
MIRSFIFDIGNVLLAFDFDRALNRILPRCELPITDERKLACDAIKNEYERGAIDRGTFLRRIYAEIGYRGTDADFVQAWEEIFTENTPMVDLVRSLHGKLPIYLLSNTSDLHVDYIFREYPFFSLFGDAVYSYRAGCMKPERKIYEITVEQLQVKPEETVFIDDLPKNIETAKAMGFHAFQYDLKDHTTLLEGLRKLGVEL